MDADTAPESLNGVAVNFTEKARSVLGTGRTANSKSRLPEQPQPARGLNDARPDSLISKTQIHIRASQNYTIPRRARRR